ncbi:hypothetical protein MUO66_09830 [Candidatus Bathyarchaeota archaeon]|nr:hypothetical protein [Candidatus Bathyarchaeota archaeon]
MSPKAKTDQLNFDLLFKSHPLPMWIYDFNTLSFLKVNNVAVKKIKFSQRTQRISTVAKKLNRGVLSELCEKKNLNSIKLIKY